jgi:hypothetical protein
MQNNIVCGRHGCNGCGWEEDSVKLDYGFLFWHGFFSTRSLLSLIDK